MKQAYQEIRQWWKERQLDSEADVDAALDHFRVLFAYHSGKMENPSVTFHDTRDIFDRGRVSSYTGDPRALFEQQNQKLCYAFLRSRIICREPLSIDLVREVHRILATGTYDERRYLERNERPGDFKRHEYITGVHEVGEPPDQVESSLEALLAEVNQWEGDTPLVPAAYFHARFEHIHPFADGNGRVGRTLMNFWLMCHREPPVVIYEEDRKEYYKALEQYDADEEIQPMAAFLEAQTIRTWSGAVQRAHGESTGVRNRTLDDYTMIE